MTQAVEFRKLVPEKCGLLYCLERYQSKERCPECRDNVRIRVCFRMLEDHLDFSLVKNNVGDAV
ncbi:MAG: hypothetical protein ACM34I_01390 [bacterium]